MQVHGNTVVVYSHDDFERLMKMPASIRGWYDPERAVGVVSFRFIGAAIRARREA